MDTQTLPTREPRKVYVQLPANLQPVVDFLSFVQQQGWKPKKYNFYNKQLKRYASAQELYPMFRNNQAI